MPDSGHVLWCRRIVTGSSMLLQESVMGSRAAMQALVPGRVVLVTNSSSGLPELGAICGAPATASKGIQLGPAANSGACLSPWASLFKQGSVSHVFWTQIYECGVLVSHTGAQYMFQHTWGCFLDWTHWIYEIFSMLLDLWSEFAFCLAGPQGKQYYVVALHSATPMDDLEQEQAASSSNPGTAKASGAFQVPSGFVLKGAQIPPEQRSPIPCMLTWRSPMCISWDSPQWCCYSYIWVRAGWDWWSWGRLMACRRHQ